MQLNVDFNWEGFDLNGMWVQTHIWVKEDLIWYRKGTLQMERVWFEWFEGAHAHLSWRGLNLSGLRMQNGHLNWRGFALSGFRIKYILNSRHFKIGLRMQMHIRIENGSIWMASRWKSTLVQEGLLWMCKGTFGKMRAYLSSKGFSLTISGCKCIFETKKAYLSGFRLQRHIWEQDCWFE